MMKVSAAVFENEGNRFLVPGFWWTEEDRPGGWLLNVMGFSMCLGINYEKNLLELDADDNGNPIVPCIHTTMGSPRLLHGGCTVFMISGPLFDSISAEKPGSQP